MEEKPENGLKKLGLFVLILGDLIGFTLAGLGLGYLSWKKLDAPEWIMIVTSSLGLILAFIRIYEITKKEM